MSLSGAARDLSPKPGGTHLHSQEQGSDDNAIEEEDPVQQVAEFGIQQAEALCLCAKK